MTYLHTSESVSEGHPDKLSDQISDAILDAALEQDPASRVAAETFVTTNFVLVGGEITTKASLDIEAIVRKTIKEVGYTHPDFGIDAATCTIKNLIHEQSRDIAQGVNQGEGLHKEQGAGDQGFMVGYACTQTPELMPLPIQLSQRLTKKMADLRKSGVISYLRPDSKSQVTVEYEGNTPLRVDTVVISTQHGPEVEHAQIKRDIIDQVIKAVIPAEYLDEKTKFLVNPTGKFVIGGPHGDAGLTGRKIIVDTYGGWSPHGGGAFSGKDSSKVDRTGAYMARFIAKNIVKSGLAEEAEIHLAYAIGYAEPISIKVDTFGTGKISNEALADLVRENFELKPAGMIASLGLQRPIFRQTAAYGHFGRTDIDLPWEDTSVKSVALREKALVTA